jgi:hypothetical protein
MTTEMITNASASNVALFSPAEIILCMTVAVLLGSLIAIFYGWQNPEAGRNFLATIALLTPFVPAKVSFLLLMFVLHFRADHGRQCVQLNIAGCVRMGVRLRIVKADDRLIV